MASHAALLKTLHLADVNPGVCVGPNGWVTEAAAEPLVSINPTTGDRIATVLKASVEATDAVIAASATAFAAWRDVPAPKRGDVVRDLGTALREAKEPLGDLVSLEMGKIRQEGHGEVQEMIDICDFAVGLSRQLYGLTLASERPGHRMMEQWQPLGPVGVITAFNFPVAVWAWNAAIALVCGDPVIWKPAEPTPLCAVAVQHIVNRVMGDHGLTGLASLVVGPGSTVGERLLNDARLPLISFTGSTKVGRHVASTVAGRFGRTILELGGNNAIIVTEGARLDLAARAIAFGAVGTAGQRCTSTRRVIVHTSVAAALTEALLAIYKQVPIGDPLADGVLMGPLVSPSAVEDMQKAVAQAVAEGGEVLHGGGARPDLGPHHVEPTIIRMPSQSSVVQRETFAPILYLLEYDRFEDALALHNGVPQGLSSAIFTESMRRAEEFLSPHGSDCGIANVNIGTSGAEIGGAFGGEKETGGGRESGSDAWKAYMRRQTNTVNWSDALPLAQGIKFTV
jgi:aldehyde dehydrogenase (NAD+)